MADGGERGGGEAQRRPSSGGSSVLHPRDDLDSYLVQCPSLSITVAHTDWGRGVVMVASRKTSWNHG